MKIKLDDFLHNTSGMEWVEAASKDDIADLTAQAVERLCVQGGKIEDQKEVILRQTNLISSLRKSNKDSMTTLETMQATNLALRAGNDRYIKRVAELEAQVANNPPSMQKVGFSPMGGEIHMLVNDFVKSITAALQKIPAPEDTVLKVRIGTQPPTNWTIDGLTSTGKIVPSDRWVVLKNPIEVEEERFGTFGQAIKLPEPDNSTIIRWDPNLKNVDKVISTMHDVTTITFKSLDQAKAAGLVIGKNEHQIISKLQWDNPNLTVQMKNGVLEIDGGTAVRPRMIEFSTILTAGEVTAIKSATPKVDTNVNKANSCECGSSAANLPTHSTWCPKA